MKREGPTGRLMRSLFTFTVFCIKKKQKNITNQERGTTGGCGLTKTSSRVASLR